MRAIANRARVEAKRGTVGALDGAHRRDAAAKGLDIVAAVGHTGEIRCSAIEAQKPLVAGYVMRIVQLDAQLDGLSDLGRLRASQADARADCSRDGISNGRQADDQCHDDRGHQGRRPAKVHQRTAHEFPMSL